MPDSRILRATPAVLSAVFDDGGDAPVDPGTVTVTITRADGDEVVTDAATEGTGAAARTYELAARPDLDLLTAVWSGDDGRQVTTYHEIVGGFIVSLGELRNSPDLSDQAKFPTVDLEDARAWFEDLAADACNVSFTPRFRRDVLNGAGGTSVTLTAGDVRRVVAATIDGAAVDSATVLRWVITDSVLSAAGPFPYGSANVVVAYEHGLDRPPHDIKTAALTAIRYRVLTDKANKIPDRATSISNELGTIQISQPGPGRPTGIPEVDSVLRRRRMPVLA